MSFLIHYSICDSSGLDLTVLFESETAQSLRKCCNSRFFEEVAVYKNNCRSLLLEMQTTEYSEIEQSLPATIKSRLLASNQTLSRSPRDSGLLGLLLGSQLRLSRSTVSIEIVELMVEDWKAFIGTETCSIVSCARIMLGAGRDTGEISNDVPISVIIDPEITATLGQALMSRGSYSKAYAMLVHCVEDFRTQKIKTMPEPEFYYISVLGIMKCYNINPEKFDYWSAELTGVQPPRRLLRNYWTIELADCCISQGRYSSAKDYLKKVLDGDRLSDHLGVIVNLRLNKVNRRLGCVDNSTLKEDGPLFKALSLVNHTDTDMSNECLDELHATIAFARWNGFDVAADAKAVLAANTTRPKEDWRLSALEYQCEGMRACILGLKDENGVVKVI